MAILDVGTQDPPAYIPAEPSNDSPVALTITGDPQGNEFLITLAPPKEPVGQGSSTPSGIRAPVDFVLVIDVSGSMDALAPAPGENEANDLKVLDIVKHAVRTIVTSMNANDRVAIVTFSTSAKVIVPLSRTDDKGKKYVMKLVEGLRTDSATNLWDGLKEGMNVLTADTATKDLVPALESLSSQDKKDDEKLGPLSSQRLSSIFLLTDGMPNHVPPRGHIPMLKRYLESHSPSKTQFTINTFGFGYSLDSQLLHDIAAIGKGTYGFIPDSGMVGTVFVHATANTYATFAQGGEINIEFDDESITGDLEVLGGFETTKSSWGVKVDLGAIQYGQTKDVVVRLSKGLGNASLAATVNYRPWWTLATSPTASVTQVLNRSHLPPAMDPSLLHHVHRLTFVQAILSLFPKADSSPSHHYSVPATGNQTAAAKIGAELKLLAGTIKTDFDDATKADIPPHSDALALAVDIEGEVLLALDYSSPGEAASAIKNFHKWGRHYLPSLARCHQRQQCGNFKDASLQVYGRDSPLFVKSRDEMDALFDNLPPPVPTVTVQHPYHQWAAVQQSASPPSPPAMQSFKKRLSRGGGGGGLMGGFFGASSSNSSAPPPPPLYQTPGAAPGQPTPHVQSHTRTSMASWNRKAAPCFAGQCLIRTAQVDGSLTRVDQLRRGSVLETPSGPRTVAAVIRTPIPGGEAEMCTIGEGLIITPWHPIRVAAERWAFPSQVSQPRRMACNEVFSILLEPDQNSEAHAVWVGGVLCVTLGHGIVGKSDVVEVDVRAHAFLGDYDKVVKSLAKNPDFYNDDGILESAGTVKSKGPGIVSGFIWKPVQGDGGGCSVKPAVSGIESSLYC